MLESTVEYSSGLVWIEYNHLSSTYKIPSVSQKTIAKTLAIKILVASKILDRR